MGDRANIAVQQDDGGTVYLYTHWTGYKIEQDARDALAREQRWDDHPYLTRIVFDTMSKGDQGRETGFGISTQPGEGPVLWIDPNTQTVTFKGKTVTFREFVSG